MLTSRHQQLVAMRGAMTARVGREELKSDHEEVIRKCCRYSSSCLAQEAVEDFYQSSDQSVPYVQKCIVLVLYRR